MSGIDHRRTALAALGLTIAFTLALAAPAGAAETERQTPSGLPVPRYVTLKFAKVNARAGPGDDHRLLWVYSVRGLPVQVVAETAEWRRICDPQGGLAWVHRRLTDGRRSLINMSERPAPLYRKPRQGAETVAFLASKSMATVVRCDDGWCKVKVDGTTGWAPERSLWGAAPEPQCR